MILKQVQEGKRQACLDSFIAAPPSLPKEHNHSDLQKVETFYCERDTFMKKRREIERQKALLMKENEQKSRAMLLQEAQKFQQETLVNRQKKEADLVSLRHEQERQIVNLSDTDGKEPKSSRTESQGE